MFHFRVATFAFVIAATAHEKIGADHQRYADFGAEYVKTCQLLGLYEPLSRATGDSVVLKTSETIGQGTGYRRTQRKVWFFAGVLAALTLGFALRVTGST